MGTASIAFLLFAACSFLSQACSGLQVRYNCGLARVRRDARGLTATYAVLSNPPSPDTICSVAVTADSHLYALFDCAGRILTFHSCFLNTTDVVNYGALLDASSDITALPSFPVGNRSYAEIQQGVNDCSFEIVGPYNPVVNNCGYRIFEVRCSPTSL